MPVELHLPASSAYLELPKAGNNRSITARITFSKLENASPSLGQAAQEQVECQLQAIQHRGGTITGDHNGELRVKTNLQIVKTPKMSQP